MIKNRKTVKGKLGKTTKVKVLKVKFQNLGENGAEANFTWEPKSGSFVPHEAVVEEGEPMPWES